MKTCIIFLSLFISTQVLAAPTIEGFWLTEERDAIVEIYPCGNSFCGRFVWLKDDSAAAPSLDERNQNPDLRRRPLCGLTFIGDLEQEKEGGSFQGGWIYSPRHGAYFGAQAFLNKEGDFVLRGYVFLPFLGGEQIWTRTEKPSYCWNLVERKAERP